MGSAALVALAIASAATGAPGQLPGALRVEARVDAILARRSALQAGVGAHLPLARSVGLELVGAAGPSIGRGDGFSGRVDAIGHFLLSPGAQVRWGGYVGGGLSIRYDRGLDWRGLLALVVGLEAPSRRREGGGAGDGGDAGVGVVPFVEVGYGGGVRLGIGVRRAPREVR